MEREEIIKSARSLYENPGTTEALKAVLEETFPELKESEDERIRKTLLDEMMFLKEKGQTKLLGLDINDIIAYLEKQKEQKHPNGCFTCDEYKKGYEEGRRNGFTAGYNKAMKEFEQKEQKPWKVGANAYFTPEQKPGEDSEYRKAYLDGWNARNLQAAREQKPAEWSEEDEKVLNSIIEYIETGNIYASSRVNMKVWLKSLRPQPKVTIPKFAIQNIEIAIDLLVKKKYGAMANALRETLKYVKEGCWKPSEEQMEALQDSIDLDRTVFRRGKLISLLEDLKKL